MARHSILRLAARAAGATRTVTPFAVLPPLAASDSPGAIGARVDTGDGTETSQRGGFSGSGTVSGAATGTAESAEHEQADKLLRKSGSEASSRAREQTLVFIAQDLDKVCWPDARLW